MGWARAHLAAAGQGVEGIVVAREHDDRLRYAAVAVPGLTILTYRVTFHLEPASGIALLHGLLCTVAIAAYALLCDAAAQSDNADACTQEPPFWRLGSRRKGHDRRA
jgi:multisubunit Na+/H+ antiporter MnhB subunit